MGCRFPTDNPVMNNFCVFLQILSKHLFYTQLSAIIYMQGNRDDFLNLHPGVPGGCVIHTFNNFLKPEGGYITWKLEHAKNMY